MHVPAVLVLFLVAGLAGCVTNPTDDGGDDPCASGVARDFRTCTGCPWVDGCDIPAMDANPEIVLATNSTYRPGETAVVYARNVGTSTFTHLAWAQCAVGFYSDSGRKFVVPSGTHCDIMNQIWIEPGEELVLFRWPLDECYRDNWGCAEKGPLAPGEYLLRATFCQAEPTTTPPRANRLAQHELPRAVPDRDNLSHHGLANATRPDGRMQRKQEKTGDPGRHAGLRVLARLGAGPASSGGGGWSRTTRNGDCGRGHGALRIEASVGNLRFQGWRFHATRPGESSSQNAIPRMPVVPLGQYGRLGMWG